MQIGIIIKFFFPKNVFENVKLLLINVFPLLGGSEHSFEETRHYRSTKLKLK